VKGIAQILLLDLVYFTEVFIYHQFGKPDNMIQRRPEFMTHIGQKLALGEVGGFGYSFCLF